MEFDDEEDEGHDMTNELDDFNKIPVKQRNNDSKLDDS